MISSELAECAFCIVVVKHAKDSGSAGNHTAYLPLEMDLRGKNPRGIQAKDRINVLPFIQKQMGEGLPRSQIVVLKVWVPDQITVQEK